MIMYLGNLVEIGPTEEVIHNPAHPYTETLLNAVPTPDPTDQTGTSPMEGDVDDPSNLPDGCRFRPHCQYATEECQEREPLLESLDYVSDKTRNHKTACYHPVRDQGS